MRQRKERLQDITFFHKTEDLPANAMLFDIETTGLSFAYHCIYMIGCCYWENEEIVLHQFFAENEQEECAVISAFIALCENASTLISFNGRRFDIPFLVARAKKYQLAADFAEKQQLDLYYAGKKLQRLADLPSCRQKDIECFLGIHRDDIYSGRELINVYKNYCKQPSEADENLLWLHNYDDVRGMLPLLSVVHYEKLPSCHITTLSLTENPYRDINGQPRMELLFEGRTDTFLPAPLRVNTAYAHLLFQDNMLRATVPVIKTELKYYLSDYKNYVYLPSEEIVVLKELAASVPSSRKERATPENCFVKKEGLFIKLPPSFRIPTEQYLFKEERRAKEQYVAYSDTNSLQETLVSLFSFLLKTK